jgi:hypothetical protein
LRKGAEAKVPPGTAIVTWRATPEFPPAPTGAAAAKHPPAAAATALFDAWWDADAGKSKRME